VAFSDEKMDGDTLNHHKPVLDEQLAFLSVKHGVYLAELFEAIVTARDKGKATCEDLKIDYRGSINGEAIILITKENKVVTQFRATEELLLRKNIVFEDWMDTDKIRNQIARQNTAPNQSRLIQDLRHGMKKVTIEAKVLETSEPLVVHTQYGNSVMLINAWIADETGKIKLCLWNEQANAVKVGDTIQIKNGSVTTFRGERQIRIGRKGAISVLQSCDVNAKSGSAENPEKVIYA
jgi:replication factor A1